MIGWRRKAKAERENVMSSERLYDLVNQTLLSNFGPLGSYAITRREASDSDDIFHTMLASSVAHNIVSSLIEHKAVVVTAAAGSSSAPVSLAPIDLVPVPAELAAAVTALSDAPVAPMTPMAAEIAAVVSSGDHATAAVAELAASEMARSEHARLAAANAS